MAKDRRSSAEVAAANLAHLNERGGPGLSSGYTAFVVARDLEKGRILLGGLGGMGIGQMWFDEAEHHKDYAGYDEALLAQEANPDLWGEGSIFNDKPLAVGERLPNPDNKEK